ncbi:MAG: hypothetical protein PVI11_00770 [Candidatus Aminicenantes bacterium]|jgi:glutaredoxin
MKYLLFTYPHCSNCEKLKNYLSGTYLDWQEYSLIQKDSKTKIREYLTDLKRDDKGAIIIPTLIAQEESKTAVLNSQEELDDWLKSKG